jgi:putative ABC transport system permease protein
MGADLVVVPKGTLVNLTSSLLTVQPTEATLDVGLAERIRAVTSVGRVAPQRLVQGRLDDGQEVQLIAFDPAEDFSVLPWLREQLPGPMGANDLVAGGRMPGILGETLLLCGVPHRIYGRLGTTGVGPFDNAYFVSFAMLENLAAGVCGGSGAGASGAVAFPAAAAHAHLANPAAPIGPSAIAAPCFAGFRPGLASAFLLQLDAGAGPEQVKFALAQIPDVKVVEGNGVLTASRQALGTLFVGIGAFTALLLTATLILVSLLFSAIVQERRREVGLLRSMGAKPGQVMTIILAEAAMITGLGGLVDQV